MPLLTKNATTDYSQDTLVWHYPHFSNQGGRPATAIRIGDYKLVENYESGKIELFNLKTDESESRNIAKKFRKKTAEMYSVLQLWKQKNNVQLPIKNNK
jgi:hypothetical protein